MTTTDRLVTIAGSPRDQRTPAGVDNPYWEAVRRVAAVADPYAGVLPRGDHDALTARYAYAIPTPGDLAWLADVLDGRGLVEVGAGSGYWAWQATQYGVDVVAYEPGVDDLFAHATPYAPLRHGDAVTAARAHADRALFLCWPSYSAPWAAEALAAYEGDTLVYVGEGREGCCADDDFFEVLDAGWVPVGSSPWHVSWWLAGDAVTAYRRATGTEG